MKQSFNSLFGLSGTLWPIHLKPLKDELLSSWIIRLAHGNGYKVETFCTYLFGARSNIWNRDIDVLAPDYVRKAIMRATGVSESIFYNTTLRSYEGALFEKINENGVSHWLLSLGIHHRKRKNHGLMACPKCLEEDEQPYFRKLWRIAFSVVCLEHRCWLIDECPNCGNPIVPHRVDIGRGIYSNKPMLVLCWNCGCDLRAAMESSKPNDLLYKYQEKFEAAVKIGWCEHGDAGVILALSYFEGLHQLMSGLRKKESIRRVASSQTGFYTGKYNNAVYESLPVSERGLLLRLCGYLMSEWPSKFTKFVKRTGLRYSDLKIENKELVFWYDNVIRKEFWNGNSVFSDREKESLFGLVEKRKGYYSNKESKNISGRDISAYVRNNHHKLINDDLYDRLLCSIDHEIASTVDTARKNGLLRDKIMYAYARINNLTLSKVEQIQLNDFECSSARPISACFYQNAATTCTVYEWVRWYIANIRPHMRPIEGCNKVFISARTRSGLKKSTISARFNKAIKNANLERYLKSYADWVSA